ncbi:MAG TPA: hypothetical protein DEF51_34565, partial [Myxococcales bacterium]|nr:hypothetical protein [Myxococcales bacterium]
MAASILFFESDPDFAAAVRGALEARGASVEIVDDGNVGLAQATSSAPDLILLTIELPQMNGFLVCKKLKKNPATQSIPVVILSSEATEEIFEQHRKLRTRAEEYVRKPIDVDALLARVGELVPLDAESVAAAEPLDLSDDAMEIPIEEVEELEPIEEEENVDDEIDAFAESAFDALVMNEEGGSDSTMVAELPKALRAELEAEAEPAPAPKSEAPPPRSVAPPPPPSAA